MTGRLIAALGQIGGEFTGEDLTDAVWLLGQVYRRVDSPAVERPQRPEQAPTPTEAGDRDPPPPDDGQTPGPSEGEQRHDDPTPPDREPAQTGRPEPATAQWHLPRPDRLLDRPSRLPVRSPGAMALDATLRIGRALRPLRRRMPSRTAVVIDEEQTVRNAVDGGLWVPASRPALDRWLDLALVVDESASMVIWRRTGVEFRELMTRMGGFRDVRVWRCDTDVGADEPLTVRPEGGRRDAPGRDVRELVDPTGQRVILLFSDCVGRAWSTGQMLTTLGVWATSGPTAIVEPLPPRLWQDCDVPFVAVRLAARRPAAPNSRLRVVVEDGTAPPGSVPVPVLALEPRWFAAWASLVTATGPEFMSGTAVFARDPRHDARPRRLDDGAAPDTGTGFEPPPRSADDLLEHYESFASTQAVRLARYLAVAPLNLPVMRLIQDAMLPGSQRSVLAEVFLGGLLRRQAASRYARADDPDEIGYDFAPGVRARLLDSLPRHEKLTVLARVSDHVSAKLGSPVDFRAFLSAAAPAVDLLQRDPPFAKVALQVLEGIGGRYGDVAAVLRRKVPRHEPYPDAPEPTLPDTSHSTSHLPQVVPSATPPADPGESVSVSPPPTKAISAHSGGESTASGPQPEIFGGVPYRNPHFTGRESLLRQLRAALTHGSRQMALLPYAIHGLGGVGKTQLAVEYTYRYAAEYDLIWWVPAESITAVRASMTQLAERMGVASADVSQAVSNVLHELRTGTSYRHWLIVFDNADRPEELRDYLPFPTGHVLITSRNPDWANVADQMEVDVFARTESVALLQRRGRGISSEDADGLAEKLGDLPLALDQAAAWQAETGMPARDMIRLLDERMRQLLEQAPMSYPASVMATWDLAFGRLRERSPGAAQLLELCSFFGNEPIAVSLLWDGRHAAELPGPVRRVLGDDILLRRAIREMQRYALAKVDPTRDRIEVHRLVQAVLREQMSDEQRAAARDAVHGILAMANPSDPDNPKNWDRHAELSPHVTSSGVVDAAAEGSRRVALDQIRYRFIRGDFVRSRTMGAAVYRRWRETLGADHELTLLAQRHLSNALRELGDNDEAATLAADALDRFRRVFGEDHEHTLRTANSVAHDLRLRGEFKRARQLDEENLERHRRVYARDDPETLRQTNNVAVNLRLLGDYSGALALDTQVYELNEAILGSDHPSTYLSLVNVARDHYDAGRFDSAYQMLAGALPRIRARMGETSRQTLIGQRIFAMVQRRMGAYVQARELAEELYQGARQLYRPDHERMLSTMITYANALVAVGEVATALGLGEQTVQRYRERYGEHHPFTLAAYVFLGTIRRALGDHRAARELDERARDGVQADLGTDHPYALYAMIGLCNDLVADHEHTRARELSAETYELARRTRGQDHPDTLLSALNHALDLRSTGDRTQADELRADALGRLGRLLGEAHPAVRAAADGIRGEPDIELWAM